MGRVPALPRVWQWPVGQREVATPVPADVSDFYYAEKFRPLHGDLEDDLVLAGCSRAKAGYLVTTDKQLLRHADISAKTPSEMLALPEAGLVRPVVAVEVVCRSALGTQSGARPRIGNGR